MDRAIVRVSKEATQTEGDKMDGLGLLLEDDAEADEAGHQAIALAERHNDMVLAGLAGRGEYTDKGD
jgi:hypothetical protein